MDFERKLIAANRLLESKGIHTGNSAPPMFRLLRFFGIRIAPPHFRGFAANALTMGAFFSICWGAIMALFIGLGFLPHKPEPLERAALLFCTITLVSGILFGLAMAAYYRHGANKNGIPGWSDFAG